MSVDTETEDLVLVLLMSPGKSRNVTTSSCAQHTDPFDPTGLPVGGLVLRNTIRTTGGSK